MPTPEFIDKEIALTIHSDQIERYGGTLGIRDLGLLESALAQPQASFNGSLLHPTIAEQAAAYLYHISRNHPFIDGNKRTAFGVMEAFIRVNGYLLNLPNEEKYDLVLRSAQGELGKTELSELLRANLIQLQE